VCSTPARPTVSLRTSFPHCRSTGHVALCRHVVKLQRWPGSHNVDILHGSTVPLRWIIFYFLFLQEQIKGIIIGVERSLLVRRLALQQFG